LILYELLGWKIQSKIVSGGFAYSNLLLGINTTVWATEVGGPQAGIWTLEGSPYLVTRHRNIIASVPGGPERAFYLKIQTKLR